MNNAEWLFDFFYLKSLNRLDEKNKVEPVLNSSKNNNNYNESDKYYKTERKYYYGKKRRYYIDYC